MDTIALILHVTAAAILVGPQVLMFFAVVPATWLIEDDERLKRSVLRVVAGRFGMLAAGSIVVLLVTGLYQYYTLVPLQIREAPNNYVFGAVFSTKMLMFTLLVGLIFVHTRLYSRKISALSDEVMALERDPSAAGRELGRTRAAELEVARRKSFTFSTIILATSMFTMWLGVALGHESFSWALR